MEGATKFLEVEGCLVMRCSDGPKKVVVKGVEREGGEKVLIGSRIISERIEILVLGPGEEKF